MSRNYIKIFAFVAAILFGIFMFIYGGFDDSPGAQLLGLVIFVIALTGLIRSRGKTVG